MRPSSSSTKRLSHSLSSVAGFHQTLPLPVNNVRPLLIMKNTTTPITAVTSQSSMFTRSTQTAFFILMIPLSP